MNAAADEEWRQRKSIMKTLETPIKFYGSSKMSKRKNAKLFEGAQSCEQIDIVCHLEAGGMNVAET